MGVIWGYAYGMTLIVEKLGWAKKPYHYYWDASLFLLITEHWYGLPIFLTYSILWILLTLFFVGLIHGITENISDN